MKKVKMFAQKGIKFLLLVFCCMYPMSVQANEISQEDIQEEILEEFDFSEIDEMMKDIFPREKLNFKDTIVGLISGDMEFSIDLVKEFVWDQFTYELENSRSGLIHILLLVIIAAIFANFSGMFQSTQVSEISFLMLYMLLITICLHNFRILADAVTMHLGSLTEFIKLLGPIYFLAVGFATGSSTSVAFYQLVLLLVFLVEMLVLNFLIPLTQIYLIMRILGELSTEIHVSKFAELLETIITWTLKTLMGGVIGLNVIQGLIAPAIDSVKRSLLTRGGEALPIVGDAIGGVAEVFLGTAVLIKNSIGVVGMIVCLIVCLVPLIQMAVTSLMYQFVAALIQPVSDKRMVNCVGGMADSSKILLKIVSTTGILFLLTIAVVASRAGG